MTIFKSGKIKGPDTRYVVFDCLEGELLIYQSQKYYIDKRVDKADCIRFVNILCAM